MPLTPNQQRSVDSLPPNQRRARALEFLQQNAGRQNTNFGAPNSPRGNPSRPAFSGNESWQRASTSTPRNRSRRVAITTTPIHTFTNTGILTLVASTEANFAITYLPVEPSYIPSLTTTAQSFGQWRYRAITIRFVSTSPSTAPGLVFYAITPTGSQMPSNLTAAQALPGLVLSSIHSNGPGVTPPLTYKGKWYQTGITPLDHPGDFVYGLSLPPADSALGYFQINYTIDFQLPQVPTPPRAITLHTLTENNNFTISSQSEPTDLDEAKRIIHNLRAQLNVSEKETVHEED